MSRIEWTDETWNPVRGCNRVSEGCRNCYAERYAARFSGPDKPFEGFARHASFTGARRGQRPGLWTGRVELIPEKLDEPLHWRKPRSVFVNSMSDLFHEALDFEDISAVLRVCWTTWHQTQGDDAIRDEDHTYQILTKRAKRMRDYFRWLGEARPGSGSHLLAQAWPLPNVWLGVSVEDQATADERIPLLLQTPAAKRFVSYEPALGPVDISAALRGYPEQVSGREYVSREMALDAGDPSVEGSLYRDEEWEQTTPGLDWVIVGGESGPGARPLDVAWIRSVVRQCREASVPCFVKQLGARPCTDHRTRPLGESHHWTSVLRDPKGGDPAEWPEDLRVREFPS